MSAFSPYSARLRRLVIDKENPEFRSELSNLEDEEITPVINRLNINQQTAIKKVHLGC